MSAAGLLVLLGLLPLVQSAAQAVPARGTVGGAAVPAPAGPVWTPVPPTGPLRPTEPPHTVPAMLALPASAPHTAPGGNGLRPGWFVTFGALVGAGGGFALCYAKDT